MLKKYSPYEERRMRVLSTEGTLVNESSGIPLMKEDQIIQALKYMIKARLADEWAVSLNRQGRMPTYAPNKGQEANSLGAVMALREDDWIVPAFREMAGMLYRGIPLSQYYLYWLGNEMGSNYDIEKYHTLPLSVPLASQALHAVGLSYADKYRESDRATLTFLGDGATSEGDFYEAMNFAGVWNTATILFIQNNQWAISTPRSVQTKTQTLAEKANAAGIPGIQVDGNDIFAVYAATTIALERARSGGGPTLIEGVTYRLGAHTTADDPTRYREDSEVEEWLAKDPLLRLEKYITSNNIISSKDIEEIKLKTNVEVKSAFEEAAKFVAPTIEDAFKYTFEEMPELLKEQMDLVKAGGKEDV